MLSAPVSTLAGVGDKTVQDLATLNIHTIGDLLEYFPSRYSIVEVKPLNRLIHGDDVTIVGKIVTPPAVSYHRGGRTRLVFSVRVEKLVVKAVLFNRTYAKQQLQVGTIVTLIGKWDARRLQITVQRYKIGSPTEKELIQAIYSVKGKLSSARLSAFIKLALDQYSHAVEEILPESFLHAYKLPTRQDAIRAIHHPRSREELKHARRRFVYEELLIFQLKLHIVKKRRELHHPDFMKRIDEEKVNEFILQLPFELTNAQTKATREIINDMKAPKQMNRLLQGDVGSGKTILATICLYAIVTSGKQGALMIPTEILAEQHYKTLIKDIGERANVALLTSSVTGKKRRDLLAGIKENSIQIVVGTHSLIQDDVQFNDLGLVIIDEQHRFGVEQRQLLREKGIRPDVLFMTATPIPRTLAITAFGDLDISILDELPKGRKEVATYWVNESMLERILTFIKKRVKAGEQVYFVSPLIEESEAFDYQNAIDLYNKLTAYYGPSIKVGLLHGKLPAEEKDKVMQKFMNNEIQILVSTTVIEVGVNVPNASVMVIYDAERFGLSQLHQLRGRVGRGNKQSYCILIADPKGEVGKERMRLMTETTDGFRLAEEDLKLRGPGDFFGKKQSGLPEFKTADLIHDYRALEVARRDAHRIVSDNLLEKDVQFKRLKDIVMQGLSNERLD